ncbi:hypothetical protein HF086_003642 [Spodoptera exigua]|uniref:FLYWCH-type domain-containing protein n=1 Tax=Spodoptera exigua TaxID=7107 RepID=A0A922MG60_SPOEX|nr:hypothetical protein HF086_003642 [Spodoptera exigua]
MSAEVSSTSCSQGSNITFIKSQRGGTVLLRAGHSYHKKRNYKSGASNWHCINRPTCKGTLTITGKTILKETRHSCIPNFEQTEIKSIINTCKNKIAEDASTSIQEIFESEILTYKEKGYDLVQKCPEYKNVKCRLANYRKKAFGINKIQNQNITQLEIPKKFENFLLCDYNDGNERIIVFATEECILQLTQCKTVYIDGTFKFVVKPFIQLFTIHRDLGSTASSNNILPLVYALLPNKKKLI